MRKRVRWGSGWSGGGECGGAGDRGASGSRRPRWAAVAAGVVLAAVMGGVLAGPAAGAGAAGVSDGRTRGTGVSTDSAIPDSAIPDPGIPTPGNPDPATMDAAGDHALGAGTVRDASRPKRDVRPAAPTTRGMDVSGWQSDQVDWTRSYEEGARFAYIKATEDTDYRSRWYDGQRAGALKAGLAVGPYHYANPAYSGAEEQADYFFHTGVGGAKWTADGRTLPPMVDLEAARPPLNACYGMTREALADWTDAFLKRTAANFGRAPVVYTNASWWESCIGDDDRFAAYPLAIARWRSVDQGPGALPGKWDAWTFWQHWDHDADYPGPGALLAGDQQLFAGDEDALRAFAVGGGVDAAAGAGGAGGRVEGGGDALAVDGAGRVGGDAAVGGEVVGGDGAGGPGSAGGGDAGAVDGAGRVGGDAADGTAVVGGAGASGRDAAAVDGAGRVGGTAADGLGPAVGGSATADAGPVAGDNAGGVGLAVVGDGSGGTAPATVTPSTPPHIAKTTTPTLAETGASLASPAIPLALAALLLGLLLAATRYPSASPTIRRASSCTSRRSSSPANDSA